MLPLDKEYDKQLDDTLAKLSCEGSLEAFKLLLFSHQPFIYNLALRMLTDEHRAKVLTKQVAVKLLLNLRQACESGDVGVWIYRLVVGEVRRMLHDNAPVTGDDACLSAMAACLPIELRFIFILAGIFNLPVDTVSSVLEIPVEAVQHGLIQGTNTISQFIKRNYLVIASGNEVISMYQRQPFLNENCASQLIRMLRVKCP